MKKVKEMVVFYLALFFHLCDSFSDAGYFSALIKGNENNATAEKCISNIMEHKILLHSAVVSFVHSNDDVDYLIEMINNLEYYSIAVRSFSNINLMIDTDIYVMVTENLRQLQFGMSQITFDSFWDPRAKIIVHVNNITSNEINEVFDIFLKHKTFDVILITTADNDHDDAKIFTYNPFEVGCCGKKFKNAILVTHCNDYESVEEYFPKKPKNQLRSCAAKVLIREDVPNIIIKDNKHIGIEQYLLKIIAEVKGMTLEFKPTTKDLGIVLPNRTATGLLKFLQNNEADIVAGGFILMKNRYDIFDCVYGYNFATLDVYTPDADHAIWNKLYEEFDTEIWILVIVCFTVITIISTIVLRLTPKLYHSLSGLLLKLWGFFYLGNTNEHLLKVKRLRLILTCWIWFTFFVSNFYTTALYSLVTAQVKQSTDYLTPEDLHSLSPLQPCISDEIRTYYKYAFQHDLPENYPLPECNDDLPLNIITTREDLYSIEMTYRYEMDEDKYIDDEGNRELDFWRFSADTIITLYLSRGYPMTREFQILAQQIFESGMLQYHKNTIEFKTRAAVLKIPKTFKKIRLVDFENHFLVLIIGSVASGICFCIEICLKRHRHFRFTGNIPMKSKSFKEPNKTRRCRGQTQIKSRERKICDERISFNVL